MHSLILQPYRKKLSKRSSHSRWKITCLLAFLETRCFYHTQANPGPFPYSLYEASPLCKLNQQLSHSCSWEQISDAECLQFQLCYLLPVLQLHFERIPVLPLTPAKCILSWSITTDSYKSGLWPQLVSNFKQETICYSNYETHLPLPEAPPANITKITCLWRPSHIQYHLWQLMQQFTMKDILNWHAKNAEHHVVRTSKQQDSSYCYIVQEQMRFLNEIVSGLFSLVLTSPHRPLFEIFNRNRNHDRVLIHSIIITRLVSTGKLLPPKADAAWIDTEGYRAYHAAESVNAEHRECEEVQEQRYQVWRL